MANNGMALAGDPLGEAWADFRPLGLHFRTASTEARQGCTCKGYENITKMTIAALPIVEATEGISVLV